MTSVVAFSFLPKILGGGVDLPIVILLEKECSFSGTDNVGGDTQTLLDAQKN